MIDRRSTLPTGTRLRLHNGELYEIAADAIGAGGGSIIYPAYRLILQEGVLQSDGFRYVLKECYPVCAEHSYVRQENGEIVPASADEEAFAYLQRAKQMQRTESDTSRAIYRTASRILPIRSASDGVTLQLPDGDPVPVSNTVTVMESLAEKGRSLGDWLREYRRIPPAETFRILQQLLFALAEIHAAGYLHLDIQDGNIFLRGALKEKNEILTLIDFGSARALVNGKTLPIEDRVIFTSYGYSAPEIRLHNDGTLCLGPEADLYSVGCLALYLLTGDKPDARAIYANKSGIYLKPNHLRRMAHCPRHLVDRMQQVLAKALANDPAARYRSAAEMLVDVEDLGAALTPYRSDLSALTYDAFICYKHGPIDSPAALALQRRLENYRAPKGVSERRKPFRRVFVDEGELSSCADFGQQVREALKNSGYLIVICSPDTPHSPWVRLEIETFLQFHDRSRILAVLTGGDETVSFPDALKGRDGEGEILAADARGDGCSAILRRLRHDALPKLAAPMLGIPYDALKQRHRIYRLQRIAAAALAFLLVALGFAAYAFNRAFLIQQQAEQLQAQAEQIQTQADRIEAEYRAALINESRFMAEQAERRLAENDPRGAIKLAIAALPSETQDRPIVAEAEYILSKALGIYRTPTRAKDTVSVVGLMENGEKFFTDASGRTLFTHGYGGELGIIDADTLAPLGTLSYSTTAIAQLDALLLPENDILLPAQNMLSRVVYRGNAPNERIGDVRWSREIPDLLSAALTKDNTEVAVLTGYAGDAYLNDSEQSDRPRKMCFEFLSAADGTPLRSVPFHLDGDQYVHKVIVAPNGRWAALITENERFVERAQTYHNLYLVNLLDGHNIRIFGSDTEIHTLIFHDSRFALIRSKGEQFTTGHSNANYSYRNPNRVWLETYLAYSQKIVFSHQLTHVPRGGSITDILYTEYDAGYCRGIGWLFTFADRSILIDNNTGAKIRDYTLNADAQHIRHYNNGNAFETINADGTITRTAMTIETTINIPSFEENVSAAIRNGNRFYVQNTPLFSADHAIYVYEAERYDAAYTPIAALEGSDWYAYVPDPLARGSELLLAKDHAVCLANLETGALRMYDIPTAYGFGAYAIDCLSADGTLLYWHWYDTDAGHSRFFRLSLTDGTAEEIAESDSPWSIDMLLASRQVSSDSGALQLLSSQGALILQHAAGQPIWQITEESPFSAACFSSDEQRVYVAAENGTLSSYLTEDGTTEATLDLAKIFDTTLFYDVQLAWLDASTLAVFTNRSCALIDASENGLAVKAYLPDCVLCIGNNDRFLLCERNISEDKTLIGSFRRYGLDDLIAMGNAVIGSTAE